MAFSTIIVAAGRGRRMGFDKLMAPLCGKPVLQHSIEAFLSLNDLIQLVVVTDSNRFEAVTKDLTDARLLRIDGGKERHHSVAAGLAAISDEAELIAVHDGARPLIRPEQIQDCLELAKIHRAASCAHRITDTLKRANNHQKTSSSVERSNLWAMETPQIFDRKLLRQAYIELSQTEELVTDEVSAVEKIGVSTHLVENPFPNPKITFPQDLTLAEKLVTLSE